MPTQDEILLSHPTKESRMFWCQGCNCDRPSEMRVIRTVYHQGRMYRHPRCTVCMEKVKENS